MVHQNRWLWFIRFTVCTSFVVGVSYTMFLPPTTRSQYSNLVLVWGCRRPLCRNSEAFGGLFGAVRGQIVELKGHRVAFGTGKFSCMCRVAVISLHLAVFTRL